nr:reverse transcriptase domain-containing protein [Tanacetum cinerariifolium]
MHAETWVRRVSNDTLGKRRNMTRRRHEKSTSLRVVFILKAKSDVVNDTPTLWAPRVSVGCQVLSQRSVMSPVRPSSYSHIGVWSWGHTWGETNACCFLIRRSNLRSNSTVQLHNESPSGLVRPIRLSFEDEGGPEEKKDEEPEDLRKPYKEGQQTKENRRCLCGAECSSKPYTDRLGVGLTACQTGDELHTGCPNNHANIIIHEQLKVPRAGQAFLRQGAKDDDENDEKGRWFFEFRRSLLNTKLPKEEHPEKGTTAHFRGSLPPRHSYGRAPPCSPTVSPSNKENLDRYCEYHDDKGHYTNDCFHLKKQLDVALESKKLNYLIKDVRQRGNNKGRKMRRNNERGKVINMVRESGKELKCKSLYPRTEEWMNVLMSFPSIYIDDVPDGPLIIEAKVEGYWEDRAGGTVRWRGLNHRAMMKFIIVRAYSPYNIILGHTGLRELRAISSIVHAMIKFPTPRGIATLCARAEPLYECRCHRTWWVPMRLIKHALNVNNSVPLVAQKRRILGAEKSRVVTREVEEWMKAGIVRPVKYPTWISNLVLVKKVDGTWRMCIDFKNPDASCPKDYYPLPEINLKIEAVMGHPFKSFLDAYKGYHQLQISKEDEEKIVFNTNQGTYFYVKMSFGLKNAGAIYQRLVDLAFKTQLGRNLEAYLDDMVIKSKTKQEMIADIAETFDNLRKINMKLNPMKCSFGVGKESARVT